MKSSVRQSRGGTEQNQRAPAQAHFRKAGFYEMSDVVLRHAFAQSSKDRFIDFERSLASEAHQFEFVRRFAAAAGNRDGIGGNIFKSGSGRAQMIGVSEIGRLFDTQPPGADALIGKRFRG